MTPPFVIPAKAGISFDRDCVSSYEIPAFAGMTVGEEAKVRKSNLAACVLGFSLLGLCCLNSGSGAYAQERGDVVAGELGRALDVLVDTFVEEGFSGALLVAKDGKVVLKKGYGLADREKNLPVSSETAFDIGSITKQFTAAAILTLEMQGKLSTSDRIGKYFGKVTRDKRKMTLHHLLTHTAGLRDVFGPDYREMTREQIIERAMSGALKYEVGERYFYSNAGYSLLGAIVEIVSGQPYETYLREALFRPAGMPDTGYRLPEWPEERVAVGYTETDRWGTPLEKLWDTDGPHWNLRANGGILSTVSDMYRWHLALQGETILSADAKAKLFTPHVPEDRSGRSHYGYGWAITDTGRDTTLIWHNGGNGIFFADFRHYIDEGVLILEMTNCNGTYRKWMMDALHNTALGLPPAE